MGSKGGKESKSNGMRVRERVEAMREGEMPTGRRERRGGEQRTWIPETRSAFSLAHFSLEPWYHHVHPSCKEAWKKRVPKMNEWIKKM